MKKESYVMNAVAGALVGALIPLGIIAFNTEVGADTAHADPVTVKAVKLDTATEPAREATLEITPGDVTVVKDTDLNKTVVEKMSVGGVQGNIFALAQPKDCTPSAYISGKLGKDGVCYGAYIYAYKDGSNPVEVVDLPSEVIQSITNPPILQQPNVQVSPQDMGAPSMPEQQ